MKNVEYLDQIPKIPMDLYPEVFWSLEEVNFGSFASEAYGIYPALPGVSNFVRSTFAEVFNDSRWLDKTKSVVGVQRLDTGYRLVHKDITRLEAFNYIIELGGDDVRTVFYDDNKNFLEQYVIERERWHRLNTDVYHSVENNTDLRVAVTGFIRLSGPAQLLRNLELLG